MRGTVIKSTGKEHTVKILNGQIVRSILKGNFRKKGIKSTNPIVVGDIVDVSNEVGEWIIYRIHERRNNIVRKSVNLSKQTHIIAANIDQAILIVTLDSPITSAEFIDRFLVAGASYGIDIIIYFNKLDILNDELLIKVEKLKNIYTKIGYTCLCGSILENNLKVLKEKMKNKINLISGHSGVGKSTLINLLQPGLEIKVSDISSTHNQGQHTTTFSELYQLDFGGSVIDSPGIKGFGLVDLKIHEIGNYFPEFFVLKKKCKFHNCLHRAEPDCAVKSAVEHKDIDISRYKNYLNMLSEDQGSFRTLKY